jgi:peptidoglycan hydrolase-like protein with peptidoglycan-binding domain
MIGPYLITKDAYRRAAYGKPCGKIATAASVVIDGRMFKCRVEAVEPFQAWEQIRAGHGYQLTGNDTGIYNCRHMNNDDSKPMSFHSWGMALDVNWLENPAGSKLVTDIPQAMINDILALRTNSDARVFRWGGDWDWDGISSDHSFIDAMHWEVVAHPLDLATGIAGFEISPTGGDELLPLQYKDGYSSGRPEKKEDVKLLQAKLGIEVDGFYGNDTAAAVAPFSGDDGKAVGGDAYYQIEKAAFKSGQITIDTETVKVVKAVRLNT